MDVGVDIDRVHLVLTDDGVGIDTATRRSGLENLRRRAEELGGSFAITRREPAGTVLEWSAPIGE